MGQICRQGKTAAFVRLEGDYTDHRVWVERAVDMREPLLFAALHYGVKMHLRDEPVCIDLQQYKTLLPVAKPVSRVGDLLARRGMDKSLCFQRIGRIFAGSLRRFPGGSRSDVIDDH